MTWSLLLMQKEHRYVQRRPPLRETVSRKPINTSKRSPDSLLRVLKCFVFHMVSISIFAKERIYAFEILRPPNHTNRTRLRTQCLCF